MDIHELNQEISRAFGAKVVTGKGVNMPVWVAPPESAMHSIVDGYALYGQPRLDLSWDKTMRVVEHIAKEENKTIVETLVMLGGKKCNSIVDILENILEYKKTKK